MSEITNTATIKVVADASGVEAGLRPAVDAARKAGEAVSKVGDGASGAASKVEASSKNIIGSIQRTTMAMEAGGKQTAAYYELLGNQRGIDPNVLAPYIAQLRAVEQEQAAAGASVHEFGFQTAAAKRELLVLTHELSQGNFKKFGGSMMVIAEQTGAAGMLFSAAGLSVIGLGAAVLGIGAAMMKGAEQQKEMTDALIMTGGYAGVTSDALNVLAHDAVAMGGSLSEAKKAVTELAGTGKFTAEQIGMISQAAVGMEHATGQSIDKTIEQFESLAVQTSGNTMRATDAITKAALKLDDQYHFLTESVYEQIHAFEKDGEQKAASALAIDALAKTTKERSEEMIANLGYVARSWNWIKESIGGVGDALGNLGKRATPGVLVDKYSSELKHFDSQVAGDRARNGLDPNKLSAEQEKMRASIVSDLTKAIIEKNKADADAIAQGAATLAQSDAMHAASRIQQDDTRLQKKGMTELQVALQEYAADRAKIAAVNPDSPLLSQDAVNAHIAALTKAHTATIKGNDDRAAILQGALTMEKAALDGERAIYDERDKMLTLYHSKFGMSDEEYYAGRATARAEYLAAEAISFAKESALVQASEKQARNPAELAAAKAKYDELLRAHQKFVNDIGSQSVADSAEQLAPRAAAIRQSDDAINKYLLSLDEEAQKLEDANKGHEESKASVERETVARLDSAIAYQQQFMAQQQLNGATDEELAQAPKILKYLHDMRDERARIATAMDQHDIDAANKKAAESAEQNWKHAANTIENDLTNAILDGGGKGWKKLVRDMEMAFAKMVLQPILEPISGGLATAFSPFMGSQTIGLAGTSGATIAGGPAGSNSLIGEAQMASGLYKAVSGGLSSIGSTISTSVADAVQAGMYQTGMTSQIASNGAFASGAGTFAADGAGALAGHYIGNAIAGDYSVAHGQTVTNIASVIGAVIGGPIGGAIGGAIGGLINRAFGMGSTQVQSQGMSGTLTATSLTGDAYQNLHQDGGWFRSDKNWQSTAAFDAQTTAQFTQGLAAIEQASSSFAKSLGVSADWVSTYSKAFDITLTGDATKDAQAVADFFNGVGDELANKLVPNLADFSKAGESASATLQRLAGDFQATDQAMQMIGKTATQAFGSAGMDSAAAREQLINAFGSASAMTSETQAFATNFLTSTEKLVPVQQALDAAMASLGLSSVKTEAQFKAVATSLDLTTSAGANEFASLMALNDAFMQVYASGKTAEQVMAERQGLQDQIDQLMLSSVQQALAARALLDPANQSLFDQLQQDKAIAQAKSDLASAYNTESQAIQSSIDKLKSFSQSLHAFIDSLQLGSMSPLNPTDKYGAALAQFNATLAKAQGGDSAAQGNLQSAAQAFLQASKDANASDSVYQADYQRVVKVSDQMATWADQQVSDGQANLLVLHDQVSRLIDINSSVMTVADAINNLAVIQGQGKDSSANSTALDSIYQEMLGRTPDTAGKAFYESLLQQGVALSTVISDIKNSTEYNMHADAVAAAGTSGSGIVPSTQYGTAALPSLAAIPTSNQGDATSSVSALYQQILGRTPDQAGLAYWVSQVQGGMPLSIVADDMRQSTEYATPSAPPSIAPAPPSQSSSTAQSAQMVAQLASLNTQVATLIANAQKQADNQVDATMAAGANTGSDVATAIKDTAQATAWSASNTATLR